MLELPFTCECHHGYVKISYVFKDKKLKIECYICISTILLPSLECGCFFYSSKDR